MGTTIITSFSASKEEHKKGSDINTFPPPPEDSGMSLKQPVWHVLILAMLTFKLYLVYWAFKNWRDLAEHKAKHARANTDSHKIDVAVELSRERLPDDNTQLAPATQKMSLLESISPKHLESFEDVSPHIRAVFWLIPYANDYLFFTLACGIAKLQEKADFSGKHPVVWSLTLTAAAFLLSYLSFLDGPLYLLFLLSAIPAAFVQHALNKYWDAVEKPGLLTRHGFSGRELVAIIAGALYLGYIVCAFILLPETRLK